MALTLSGFTCLAGLEHSACRRAIFAGRLQLTSVRGRTLPESGEADAYLAVVVSANHISSIRFSGYYRTTIQYRCELGEDRHGTPPPMNRSITHNETAVGLAV